jgi:acetolactate synthase-1/2/3 large subunit
MKSYRPVILLGNGIRNNPQLIDYLCGLNIPVLTTWMGCDLIAEDNAAFCGRPGIFGQRAANIIQQKATRLFCFGARLDGEQIGYDYDRFAPRAEKWIYDIDQTELDKFPSQYNWILNKKNLSVCELFETKGDADWLAWCKALYARFRPELDGENGGKFVNPFAFLTLLHKHTNSDDVFALGSSGNAPCTFFQSYKIKQGQRVSNVSTIGAMGADIPMALGAALATGRRTICLTGDGGFQLNTQELETIRRLHLPIIFFVMSNGGYNTIRTAQLARFGRVTGANVATGLTLPDLDKTAEMYGFMYHKLDGRNLDAFEKCFIATPLIVEVMVDPEWVELPRVLSSGNPLRSDDMQDMTPKIGDLAELMK